MNKIIIYSKTKAAEANFYAQYRQHTHIANVVHTKEQLRDQITKIITERLR